MAPTETAEIIGDTARAARQERAAVKALAARVGQARLLLATHIDDGEADLAGAVDDRLSALWARRLAGQPLPADLPRAVADLLAEPLDGAFAMRLARAHEHTRGTTLTRRAGVVTQVASLQRRKHGVYYTPPDVVRFVVSETLGARLAGLEARLERASRAEALALLREARALKVFDPACGAGAFLLGALTRLRRFYRALAARLDRQGRLPTALRAPGRLALRDNLRGLDLDRRALALAELALRAEVQGEPGAASELVGQALVVGDFLSADLPAAFPDAFARPDPGFDVILGNPPYARLTRAQRAQAEAHGFETAACADIYAAFVEGLTRYARAGGRGGLIVPLSLGFSRNLRAARAAVIDPSRRPWRLASFDRIPSGLFESEVRTRTTVAVCGPVAERTTLATTPLIRFTAAERPGLFAGLSYTDVTGLAHPQLGYPRLASSTQAAGLRRLLARGERLGDALDPEGEHLLHFKHNAYGFVIVSAELPPAEDAAGRPVPQTKYSALRFAEVSERDAALALLAGAWSFWWWQAYGDGFDVTARLLSAFPVDPRALPAATRRALARRGARIQAQVRDHVAWKKNSGKRIGTYDLRRCRPETDAADALLATALDAEPLLADLRAFRAATHGAG